MKVYRYFHAQGQIFSKITDLRGDDLQIGAVACIRGKLLCLLNLRRRQLNKASYLNHLNLEKIRLMPEREL